MRVLSLTTLYPHAGAPHHGVFVENRLSALAARGHELRIVAPVPWFPLSEPPVLRRALEPYAVHARAPRTERRRGLRIDHPRYLLPPKMGMNVAPARLASAFLRGALDALRDGFVPDLIDAHYFYPDGVAAAAVARRLDLPLVVTARGTDVNLIPAYPRQRRAIVAAAAQAEHTICVADALREALIGFGADEAKITTIRNGVDLDRFAPGDRGAARRALGLPQDAFVLASVGHLTARKGHHLVLEALAELPDALLLIAGGGEEERRLRAQAERTGLAGRVRFLGAVPHDDLATVYRAADTLVLASSREGWPNVLLEAMACGTPCVATAVWGSGEVIGAPAAGRLAGARSGPALRDAIRDLRASAPDRADTRAYAEGFGWAPVAQAVERVWEAAAGRSSWGAPVPARRSSVPPVPARRSQPVRSLPARLLLTVDTEECFDWRAGGAWTVPAPDRLLALQAVAERHGVKPLYLTTYPMMTDEAVGGTLASLVSAGRAEAGLHLHAWSTPPGAGPSAGPQSYQHNIDACAHDAKLDTLIASFRTRFGTDPVAHRAGRYGVSPRVLDALAVRGVRLDLSPSAAFDCTADGGPDFAAMDSRLRLRGEMVVLPASGARRWRRGAFGAPPPGLASAHELLAHKMSWPVRLSPEGNAAQTMIALAEHLQTMGVTTLVPSLHSSSLEAGATRYAPDAAAAATILERLDEFLAWAINAGHVPTDTASVLREAQPTAALAAE